MTQTTEINLADFAEKKVTIAFRENGEGEPVEKEGTVQAASAIGLIFKEKGKADVHIIEPDWIASIEATPEKEPNVTVKKLKPVTSNFRQHLADRHGYLPKDLNNITEAQGKEIHDGIDHTSLGHKHELPKAQQDVAGETSDPLGADGGAEPDDDDA